MSTFTATMALATIGEFGLILTNDWLCMFPLWA